MKTIIFTLLVSVFTFHAGAQKSLFENLTQKYSDTDGFSASLITSDMFDLYLKKRNVEENSPVYGALKSLDNILVVSHVNYFETKSMEAHDAKKDSEVAAIHQDILKHYQTTNYTLFKTERHMGEDVKVYLKKNKDKVVSLALVTNSGRATNLVELQGPDIDLSTVSDLNRTLNLRGLENLYKINNRSVHNLMVPVPPDVPSEEQIRMMLEKNREIIEKQGQLTAEQRKKIEEQARMLAEKQKEMAERYRELANKYQRQPIFLSSPGDSAEYFIDGVKATAEEIKKLDPSNIERVEVNKDKGNNHKGTIRITTRKK